MEEDFGGITERVGTFKMSGKDRSDMGRVRK